MQAWYPLALLIRRKIGFVDRYVVSASDKFWSGGFPVVSLDKKLYSALPHLLHSVTQMGIGELLA